MKYRVHNKYVNDSGRGYTNATLLTMQYQLTLNTEERSGGPHITPQLLSAKTVSDLYILNTP